MKKIYKGLISILVISMLAAGAISAVSGPYTGCISTTPGKFDDPKGIFYYFQYGSNPISTCKTGDTQITIYDKTFIDNAINSLTNQINSLTSRISNIENNPYPKLYSSRYNITRFNVDSGSNQIATLTFTLPKDAIVQIHTDGMLFFWRGYTAVNFVVVEADGTENCIDYCQPVFYGDGNYAGEGWTGFEQTKTGYLKAGTHTVRVNGSAYGSSQADNTIETFARIDATAYEPNKADIQAITNNAKIPISNQMPPKPNSTKQ